jgi:hypothetical protein
MMEPKATPTGKGDEPPAAPAPTDALRLSLRPAVTAVFLGRAEFDAVLAVREQPTARVR